LLEGGRGLHCGLCSSSFEPELSGDNQELLQGTVVYRSTVHSFGEIGFKKLPCHPSFFFLFHIMYNNEKQTMEIHCYLHYYNKCKQLFFLFH
jgi:hypothetical protein